MLIKTDVFLAYIKEDDWLKSYAEKLIKETSEERIKLYASREIIRELYYVVRRFGIDLTLFLEKIVALTRIGNIIWVPTDIDIDLNALTLMIEYGIKSIFDAYYAATALPRDLDRAIISTDKVYDRIPSIKRVDPRQYEKLCFIWILYFRREVWRLYSVYIRAVLAC